MYSRRPHRNSHHGCRECKERRVKCDETQPQCRRCKSKGRKCTYTHLLSEYNPFAQGQHPHPHPHPHPQHRAAQLPPPTPTPRNTHQQRLVFRANNQIASAHLLSSSSSSSTSPAADATLFVLADDATSTSTEIFHHYTTVVITINPAYHASEQFWRWDAAVRALAPSHPFLYYAVLTLAALHRSILYAQSGAPSNAAAQRARHVALASAFQSRALAEFGPAVARLEESSGARTWRGGGGGGGTKGGWARARGDVDAILTCSSIVLASAFAFPPAPGEDVLDQARQVIRLFCGTLALYKRAWEAGGDDSAIGAYVRERVRAGEELGDGADAPEVEESLGKVVDRVIERATAGAAAAAAAAAANFAASSSASGEHDASPPYSNSSASRLGSPAEGDGEDPLSTFLPAISALRLLFRRLVLRPRLHTMALEWPASLPKSFLCALEKRDPLALVVLAHWARCLADFKHLWWISRWGTTVVRAVVDEVCRGESCDEESGTVDLLSGVVADLRSGGRGTTAGSGGAERNRAGAGAGEGAAVWGPCLEWPTRELGDAVAAYWHR